MLASRIVMVGESPHAHEQQALQFLIDHIPDGEPYRLWALVEILDPPTGKLYELDALILGYSALYLVEIKSGAGRYQGDHVDWYRTPPEGPARWMDPPLRLANLKAKVLKGRLRSRMRQPDRAPRVEPLIFLSHPETVLDLSSEGRVGVVTCRDVAKGDHTPRVPWRAAQLARGAASTSRSPSDITQALEALGVRKRKGKLFAGNYELGELLDDGIMQLDAGGDTRPAPSGYQDREAKHRDAEALTCRARVYLVPQQTTVERRQLLMRAADREAQLLHSVRDHKNILRMNDYVTDAPLGPTLLFDAFEGAVPLDTYLRKNPSLSFDDQIGLVEQIAQALAYCHKKEVIHGALGPHAVLVRPDPDGGALQTKLFNFQLGAGKQVRTTVHWSALASDPWALYQAPELREEAVRAPSPASDVFSLGALAHLVFSKRAPAGSVLELDARLARAGHLDVKEVDDGISEPVRKAIAFATERVASLRADDAGEWINLLLESLTKSDPVVAEPERDPLEAKAGDVLGGDLVMERRLGYGSTSVVLRVNRTSDGRPYALKVSQAAEHDERLVEEAKLLRTLEHPRIVRVVDERTIADRTCLLLTLAGDQTLQKFLAQEGSVSLDYASRFGEDLLSALDELELRRVVHRDIKPANVGVGSVSKQEVRLTLFDFSLGLAPLSELDVGTAVYRDPYLRARGAWDPAADRWSAAVTLHEALTGVRPTLPVAVSAGDPKGRVVVAAERLDPGARDRLAKFFDRAFAPDVEVRFSSAREMLRAWAAAFDAPAVDTRGEERVRGSSAAPPGEIAAAAEGQAVGAVALGDAAFAALRPDTPVEALPLSVRARNALDRAGVLTAGGVFDLPDNRLSSVRGVGRLVAQEIAQFRARWSSTHADAAALATPFFAGAYPGEDVRIDTTKLEPAIVAALSDAGIDSLAALAVAPVDQVEVIARRAKFDASKLTKLLQRGAKEAGDRELPPTLEAWVDAMLPTPRRRAPYMLELYGLVHPFEGRVDVTVRQLADHHRVTTANVYQVLSEHRAAWAKHGAILQLRELVHAVVDEAGSAPASKCRRRAVRPLAARPRRIPCAA